MAGGQFSGTNRSIESTLKNAAAYFSSGVGGVGGGRPDSRAELCYSWRWP
jgi:hypothetical protein